jgi:pyrroline-5-carboxylate reductase
MQRTLVIGGKTGHLGSLIAKSIGSSAIATGRNDNNASAAQSARIIVVTTKPLEAHVPLKEIGLAVQDRHVGIVSCAAALKISTIKRHIGSQHCVIRVMPNVFIESNHSVTFISYGNACAECRECVEKIFHTSGIVLPISESFMNAATLVGASAIAIMAQFFLWSDSIVLEPSVVTRYLFTLVASEYGFMEIAEAITNQNILGLRITTNNDRDKLHSIVEGVATGGGCTRAILDTMTAYGMEGLIRDRKHLAHIEAVLVKSFAAGMGRLEAIESQTDTQ